MTDTTQFPSRLKKLLTMNNMSQIQLCRITGISKGTMSRYLSGARHATDSNMYLIAKALNVDIVWLMGYGNEDSPLPDINPMERKKEEVKVLLGRMNEEQVDMTIKFIKSFVLIKK